MGKQKKSKNVFKIATNSKKINKQKKSNNIKKQNFKQKNKVDMLNDKFLQMNQLTQTQNKNVETKKSMPKKIYVSENEIQSTLNLMKRL